MANPLARVVMNNVSQIVHGKEEHKSWDKGSSNLTKSHEDMLKGIISSGTKHISEGKNMITLEELAKMVKGSSR